MSIPAAAVPAIVAITAAAGTAATIGFQTHSALKKGPKLPFLPGESKVGAKDDVKTVKDRRQQRTPTVITSPLGAPLQNQTKSLLGN